MASLTEVEKMKLQAIFLMEGGYVLNFNNQTFQSFIYNTVKLNINDTKYEKYGTSKAKRLKALWEIEGNITVGKVIEELLLYVEAQINMGIQNENFNRKFFEECLLIAYRLLGKKITVNTEDMSADDFLKKEVDEVSVSSIPMDSAILIILEQRISEVKKCLKSEASLAVIFLCGSILEGVLLGIASRKSKEFNQSTVSPKHTDSGKVRQFHEWTLNNLIDVAYDLRLLGLDVKKFSHSLRDFRNYIHPYQQMSSNFTPNIHTAKISWQVVKAALHDLKENFNK